MNCKELGARYPETRQYWSGRQVKLVNASVIKRKTVDFDFVDDDVHLCCERHFFRCEQILQLAGRVCSEQELVCGLRVDQDAM